MVWHTADGQRQQDPVRECGGCQSCALKACEWRHGLGAEDARPDSTGWLARRSALSPSLCVVVDFRTSGGALYAQEQVQQELAALSCKEDWTLVLLDDTGTPVGVVGSEEQRSRLLGELIESSPKVASALVDDNVAGAIDRSTLTPAMAKLQEQARKQAAMASQGPSFVVSGTELNPVLETIQEP